MTHSDGISDLLLEELTDLKHMEQVCMIEIPVLLQRITDSELKLGGERMHRLSGAQMETLDAIFNSLDYTPGTASGTLEKMLFKKAVKGTGGIRNPIIMDVWLALCLHEICGFKKERYEALTILSMNIDAEVNRLLALVQDNEKALYELFSEYIKSRSGKSLSFQDAG